MLALRIPKPVTMNYESRAIWQPALPALLQVINQQRRKPKEYREPDDVLKCGLERTRRRRWIEAEFLRKHRNDCPHETGGQNGAGHGSADNQPKRNVVGPDRAHRSERQAARQRYQERRRKFLRDLAT